MGKKSKKPASASVSLQFVKNSTRTEHASAITVPEPSNVPPVSCWAGGPPSQPIREVLTQDHDDSSPEPSVDESLSLFEKARTSDDGVFLSHLKLVKPKKGKVSKQLEEALQEVERMQERCNSLEGKIKTLESKNAALVARLDDLEDIEAEHGDLLLRCESLQARCEEIEVDRDDLREMCESHKTDLKQLEETSGIPNELVRATASLAQYDANFKDLAQQASNFFVTLQQQAQLTQQGVECLQQQVKASRQAVRHAQSGTAEVPPSLMLAIVRTIATAFAKKTSFCRDNSASYLQSPHKVLLNPCACLQSSVVRQRFDEGLKHHGFERGLDQLLLEFPAHFELVLHGTKRKGVATICREGFNPTMRKNQAHGPGEYFDASLNGRTALSYAEDNKSPILTLCLSKNLHGQQIPGYKLEKSQSYLIVDNPLNLAWTCCLPLAVLAEPSEVSFWSRELNREFQHDFSELCVAGIDEMSLTPGSSATSPFNGQKLQFLDDSNQFQDFSFDDVQRIASSGAIRQRQRVELSNGNTYEFDFQRLIQTNVTTKKERKLNFTN